jgi:hypothetical protein
MNYLHKFLQHLNESQDISDFSQEEFDEMLIPIKDLDIEYSFGGPKQLLRVNMKCYNNYTQKLIF